MERYKMTDQQYQVLNRLDFLKKLNDCNIANVLYNFLENSDVSYVPETSDTLSALKESYPELIERISPRFNIYLLYQIHYLVNYYQKLEEEFETMKNDYQKLQAVNEILAEEKLKC
jgi:molybdopterin converting factor small subunit